MIFFVSQVWFLYRCVSVSLVVVVVVDLWTYFFFPAIVSSEDIFYTTYVSQAAVAACIADVALSLQCSGTYYDWRKLSRVG